MRKCVFGVYANSDDRDQTADLFNLTQAFAVRKC